MESIQVVPQAPTFTLPVAKVRSVYQIADVERKLGKLQNSEPREHDSLRATYERMLERGPERFQMKPSGIPEMAPLYDALPNFTDVLDDVRRHVALSHDSTDGLEVTPMLLLGQPGIGKTHFARQVADLIGTGMNLVSMGSLTAGWLLSGSASQWKGAKPGKVFESLVDGRYANPVIVIDEIDKAASDAQYDPLGLAVQPAGARHGLFLRGRVRRSAHRRQPGAVDHDGQRCARHSQPDPEPDECVRDPAAHARPGAAYRTAALPVDPVRPQLGDALRRRAVGRCAGQAGHPGAA